ncbi:MAG: hypothetical protein JWO31_2442 [Phycisphaerales bacterium]|nr:hypothetical protein [Phycisphaerales bacterium]
MAGSKSYMFGFGTAALVTVGTANAQVKKVPPPAPARLVAAPVTRPAATTRPATRPAAAATAPAKVERRAESQDGGFSVALPAGWDKRPTKGLDPRVALAVGPADGDEQFGIAVFRNAGVRTPEQALTSVLPAFQKLPGFRQVESGATTFGGLPAWRVVFDCTPPDVGPQRFVQVAAVRGADWYMTTFAAVPGHHAAVRPAVDQVLSSFRFAGMAPAAAATTRPAVAAVSPATAPAGFERIESRDRTVDIAIPANWEVEPRERRDDPLLIAVHPPGADGKMVALLSTNLARAATPEQLSAFAIARDKAKWPSYRLVESGRASLGALPAWRHVYERTTEDGPQRVTQVIATHGSTCYSAMLQSGVAPDPAFAATADQVLATFRLTGRASDPAATRPAKMARFDSNEHRISFEYPDAWARPKVLDPQLLFTAYPSGNTEDTKTDFAEPIMLASGPLQVPEDDDTLLRLSISKADAFTKANPGMKVVRRHSVTVGGIPAHRLEFAGLDEGRRAKLVNVIIVRGGRVYLFSCQGDLRDVEPLEVEFQQVLTSVRFKDPK